MAPPALQEWDTGGANRSSLRRRDGEAPPFAGHALELASAAFAAEDAEGRRAAQAFSDATD